MSTSQRQTAVQSGRRLTTANQGTAKQAKRLAVALRHRAPVVPTHVLRVFLGKSLDFNDVHGNAGLPFKSALGARYALFAELALPNEAPHSTDFML
jgi:hypothetical protein